MSDKPLKLAAAKANFQLCVPLIQLVLMNVFLFHVIIEDIAFYVHLS